MGNRLTVLGLVGAVAAALCCFTPLLPSLLGTLGLSGALGYVYRDDVLVPILGLSILVMGIGIWLKRRATSFSNRR